MTGFRAGLKWIKSWTAINLCMVLCVVGIGLTSCGNRDRTVDVGQVAQGKQAKATITKRLYEVAPPQAIQDLGQLLTTYQPQVKILSPQPNQVLQSTEVSVRLQVRDLPLFQNETFEMGPHLHVILDNQPYQAVYDTSKPLVFSDLEPGTHTLRVFASRPWHESFKNDGAYDQVTFHLFSPTLDNSPTVGTPQLTYSRPKGSYGAEPIMLDFYLKDAPLHFVARQDSEDDIKDWRIRCTINGESFMFDQWQPVYLKGFKTGQNWLKLELLDEDGNLIKNAFNTTVRLIDYQPGGDDTLSKLVRGELTAADVQGIVDPNYTPPEPEPEIEPESSIEPVEPDVAPLTPQVPNVPTETPALETQPTVEESPAAVEEETEQTQLESADEDELDIEPSASEDLSEDLKERLDRELDTEPDTEQLKTPPKAVDRDAPPVLDTDQDTDQADQQPEEQAEVSEPQLEPELTPEPRETTLDQLTGVPESSNSTDRTPSVTPNDTEEVTETEPETESNKTPAPKAFVDEVPGLIEDAADEGVEESTSTQPGQDTEPNQIPDTLTSPTAPDIKPTEPSVQPPAAPETTVTDAAKDIFNNSRQRLGRFFDRFRQPDAEDKNMPPTLPEIIDEPSLKSLERDLQQEQPPFNAVPGEPETNQPFSRPAPVSPEQTTLTE